MTDEECKRARKLVEERAPLLFTWLAAQRITHGEALDLLISVYLTISRNTLGNATTLQMLRSLVIFAEGFQGADPAVEPVTTEITISTPRTPTN